MMPEINDLEEYLESSFRPVSPRKEYLERLKERLMDPAALEVEIPHRIAYRPFVVILVGVISGILLILALLRPLQFFLESMSRRSGARRAG